MLQVLEWFSCYKNECSVVVVLIATLKMAMFAYSDLYLLWPETWLKNDKGMDKLNYGTASVHCVAANINIRLAVTNIKIVLSLYPGVLRFKYVFQLSAVKQSKTLLCRGSVKHAGCTSFFY